MGRGALCIVLVVAAFSLGGAQHPQIEPSTKQDQATQVSSNAPTLTNAVGQTGPKYYKECEDRKDDRSSDLCAQWGAVDAARNAAKATWAAVFFSFVGTFLIVLTFLEQKRTSRAELRAYLAVKIIDITFNKAAGTAVGKIRIINSGNTPAFKQWSMGNIVIRTPDQVEIELTALRAAGTRPDARVHTATVHGHTEESAFTKSQTKFTPDEISDALAGKKNIFVFGTVFYEDAFKEARYTNYCFYQENWPENEGVLRQVWGRIAPFHNDST